MFTMTRSVRIDAPLHHHWRRCYRGAMVELGRSLELKDGPCGRAYLRSQAHGRVEVRRNHDLFPRGTHLCFGEPSVSLTEITDGELTATLSIQVSAVDRLTRALAEAATEARANGDG
jgi:hypothetical protein